jgi:hypothetical protein
MEPVITKVNYLVQLPGYAVPFTAIDMRFNTTTRELMVRTTEGVVTFTEADDIEIKAVDLDVPTILRNKMKDDGWTTMTIAEFIELLHMVFLSEN